MVDLAPSVKVQAQTLADQNDLQTVQNSDLNTVQTECNMTGKDVHKIVFESATRIRKKRKTGKSSVPEKFNT